MEAFPAWFPIYLLALIAIVLVVRWRAPRWIWVALAGVAVFTFAFAVLWAFIG